VPVAAVGALAVVALLLGAAAFAARPPRRTRVPIKARPLPPMPVPVWATIAALRPALNRRSASSFGAAIVGTAFAAGTLIAAAAVSGTLDTVIADPKRTGADFDAIVSVLDEDEAAVEMARVAADDGVAQAAQLIGTTLSIAGEEVWVHTFAPIEGRARVSPVITSGREPVGADEIALAELTMRDLGVDVGDTIVVDPFVANNEGWTATVVGTALVNDLWEPTAGRGGIVAPATAEAYFPEETPSIAVKFTDDAAGRAARAQLDGRSMVAAAPRSVHHIARLDWVPYALVAIATIMAAVTFVHALYTAVRTQVADLATYRVLGLSRRRTVLVVVMESTGLSLAAIALAIPLGLIIGHWGWELINSRLGLDTAVQVPVQGILAATAAVAAVGVLVAAPIARRATSGTIAAALRAE
jgi:hypothetical protein